MGSCLYLKMDRATNSIADTRMLYHEWIQGRNTLVNVRGGRKAKGGTMLYDILFVTALFATRIVLPIAVMLVVGELAARRIDRRPAKR